MDDKPTLNGEPLGGEVPPPEVPADVLRRINHADWLDQFAVVLNMRAPGSPPMTPMRLGAIQRVKLAARFIALLQKELRWLAQDNKMLRRQVVALGGSLPAPFKPEVEAQHEVPQQEGNEDDHGGR